MSADLSSCTILFADVAGSVRLFETYGDTRARAAIGECLATLSAITDRHAGAVIKTLGDEIMSTFPNANAGIRAAIDMQSEVSTSRYEGLGIQLRVGLHHGPVIEENGDVYGDAVNLAKRIGDLARANEILTTKATYGMLDRINRQFTREVDHAEVKGKAEVVDIFQVMWQTGDDMTFIASAGHNTLANPNAQRLTLVLRWPEGEQVVDTDGAVSIGRGAQADIVIPAQLASRVHCTIATVRKKFVLTDQSLNGTYVVNENGDAISLKRDRIPLTGQGQICLGSPPGEDPSGVLHFQVKKVGPV